MLNRFPKHLGSLDDLLRDPLLKHLTTHDLATFLDVSERTIRRWKNAETPRHVLLKAHKLRALAAQTLSPSAKAAFVVGLLGLALTARNVLVEAREISRLANAD